MIGGREFAAHSLRTQPTRQRFLINTFSGDPMPTPITVILNWKAALKK